MITLEEVEKRAKVLSENSVKCKCSKSIAIPFCLDRVICSNCGYWVYRTKELEFKYKINEMLGKKVSVK